MSRDTMPSAAPTLTIDEVGWVRRPTDPVAYVSSPNADVRPDHCDPTLLVIHSISLPPGEFGGRAIDALFTNTLDCDAHPYYERLRGLRVSSHFLVRRDGALVQFVSCALRAWHAGVSSFEGRSQCNDFSIGIELEGDDTGPFEACQYDTLRPLIAALAMRYPIAGLAAHSEIAPDRKTDPGPGFDWKRVADLGPPGWRQGTDPAP